MLLYHYSPTWNGDTSLTNDYHQKYKLVEPMLLALRNGRDSFKTLLFTVLYIQRANTDWELSKEYCLFNYEKDASEAVFEYIRETEFAATSASRLNCVYYFRDLPSTIKAAHEDWIDCGDIAKEDLKILEVEVPDQSIYDYDQIFYNRAYEAMKNHDIDTAIECARNYFLEKRTEYPVLETLSSGNNRIIREISY